MPLFALGDKRVRLVGAGHYIAYDAMLVGSITLLDAASIWFKVVIRAENDQITIGEGSNVQDGSVLHVDPGYPLTLGRDVTIGHKAMLHGCTVGDGALIGANTLIPEGKEIPEGVLVVGSPGKIVRPLTPEQKASLREIARGYVERAALYRRELKPIT